MLFIAVALAGVLALGRLAPRKAEVFKQTPIQITAENLYKEFKDKKEAISQYSGKYVEVTGVAESMAQTTTGLPYVILRGGDSLGNIQCIFAQGSLEQAKNIKPGQPVTLRGVCLGRVMNVILNECSLRS